MEINEKDWKLFREKVPQWQENYMEKLIAEYANILNSPDDASEKFWELEHRIKLDRQSPGVMLEMKRSLLYDNIIYLLCNNVITLSDLEGFSK